MDRRIFNEKSWSNKRPSKRLDKENKPYYITVQLKPFDGDFLRAQYKDIVPGYYMNKTHWNSIEPDGEVPDDLLKDLLDQSYQLIKEMLRKKANFIERLST